MHMWRLEFKCDKYHVYSSYLVSDAIDAVTKELTELFENCKGKKLSEIKNNFRDYALSSIIEEAEETSGPLKDETILYNYHHKKVKRYCYIGNFEISEKIME